MVDEMYLYKRKPENNTIIKPSDRGDGLHIRNNDDWEYREYEDIKNDIVSSLDRYIDMYHQLIQSCVFSQISSEKSLQ